MTCVAYCVCRLMTFVALLCLSHCYVCCIIMFVAYEVCRIMMFVANYDVCRLEGLLQYHSIWGAIDRYELYPGPYRQIWNLSGAPSPDMNCIRGAIIGYELYPERHHGIWIVSRAPLPDINFIWGARPFLRKNWLFHRNFMIKLNFRNVNAVKAETISI